MTNMSNRKTSSLKRVWCTLWKSLSWRKVSILCRLVILAQSTVVWVFHSSRTWPWWPLLSGIGVIWSGIEDFDGWIHVKFSISLFLKRWADSQWQNPYCIGWLQNYPLLYNSGNPSTVWCSPVPYKNPWPPSPIITTNLRWCHILQDDNLIALGLCKDSYEIVLWMFCNNILIKL